MFRLHAAGAFANHGQISREVSVAHLPTEGEDVGHLPNRLDTGGPNFAIAGNQRQTQRQGRCGDHPVWQIRNRVSRNSAQDECDLGSQRNRLKGGPGKAQRLAQSRQGFPRNPIFLAQISRFDDADGRDENRFVLGSGPFHCFSGPEGEPWVSRQVPEDRVRVGDDPAHLNNCSRGKLPHISFRASAMSSSEMEMLKSFQRPYRLSRGCLCLAPNEVVKSSTSCCLSAGRSRSLETTASSIECAAMLLSYLSRGEGINDGLDRSHQMVVRLDRLPRGGAANRGGAGVKANKQRSWREELFSENPTCPRVKRKGEEKC